MLNIRQANLNDVPVLRSLIQEMADYERLPLLITKKEVLARDGFGSRQSSATRGLLWNYVPVLDWNEMTIQFYKKMDATFLDDWKTVCLKGDALRIVASAARES